jgi:putative ABC transport system ATP-binding protein
MSDGETVVRTVGLTKDYKRGKTMVAALNGIDLAVARGEIVGIVGPSGSGKTTLLNLIGGLDKPTGGKVIVDGTDLSQLSGAKLADYRLRKIGFIFQFYNLIPILTAVENVELPMSFAGERADERRSRALTLLKTVGLEARSEHKPEEMSGGEQQRVAVARALANNPAIVLGDEPTGDLDSKSARSLMELIDSLRKERGCTFVLVTHDPIVVERCDRAYSVRDGKVLREVPKQENAKTEGDGRPTDGLY